MKVLIAGATGVLGRRLVEMFKDRGHDIAGLARSKRAKETLEKLGGRSVQADIFDAEAIAREAGQADIVIHAATSIPTKEKTTPKDWEMNDRLRLEGTAALATAATMIGAGQYIQQSIVWLARPDDDSFFDETTRVTEPGGVYQSAFDAENIALEIGTKAGVKTAVLRCGGFYSADAGHTRMMAEALAKRRLPIVGSGNAVSANIHSDDAASAFLAAAEAGREGLWHVTDDEPSTMAELLNEMADLIRVKRPRRLPVWVVRLFADKSMLQFFTRSTRTSNRLFKQEIGWRPKFSSYREGLREIVGHWQAEGFPPSANVKK